MEADQPPFAFGIPASIDAGTRKTPPLNTKVAASRDFGNSYDKTVHPRANHGMQTSEPMEMDTSTAASSTVNGATMVTNQTPVSTITAPSAFKPSSYRGVAHGSIPHNEIDEQSALLTILLEQTKIVGDGGGWIEAYVEKMDGVNFQEEVCMDATSLLLSFLQGIDPTACLLCQYDGVSMPPITSPDGDRVFQSAALYSFCMLTWKGGGQ